MSSSSSKNRGGEAAVSGAEEVEYSVLSLGSPARVETLRVPPARAGKVADIATVLDRARVVELAKTFLFPENVDLVCPRPLDRANAPPEGFVTIYEESLKSGLHLPLPPSFAKLHRQIGLALEQLLPNSFRHFTDLGVAANVVPSEKVRGDDITGFAVAVMTKLVEPFELVLDDHELPPPAFIIADAFLPWAGEVAGKRNIPVAYLWSMSASVYSVFYHFDLLVQNGHFPLDFSVNGEVVVDYIPGLPPTRLADLPLLIRDQTILPRFLKLLPKVSKENSLIFTSIYELEAQAIDTIKQQSSFSIYNIGPATSHFKLMNTTISPDAASAAAAYLRWLDLQPLGEVLYISLGSFLHIPESQMEEIAAGSQGSGVGFLWVARRGTSRLQQIAGDKGLVVEWCDQLRVLGHPSVGGFLSHCRWNSTKEAVLEGVPVLAFPIIMDQLPDAKAIVDDWRVGWRMSEKEFNEEDLVKSDRIAEMVGRFMGLGSEGREEISRNARELQKKCEREFADGGSYQANVDGFVNSILKLN